MFLMHVSSNDGILYVYVDRFYLVAVPESVGTVSPLRKQNVLSVIIFVLSKSSHVVLTGNYD